MSATRGFASDNAATVHPEVLAAIARANVGHAFGYGHDELTAGLAQTFAEHFGPDARAFAVWGGSAANVLCLRAACEPWQAVICADTAHMAVDECGAPEAIAGVKLLTAAGEDGRLTPELVEPLIHRVGDEHAVQPRVLSISNCTELGTVYTAREVRALAELAHDHRMLLHVDGARLANAVVSAGRGLASLTTDAGVDLLSLGGTKNGLLGAEAVVFLDPALADGFEFLRKQTLQLASKMRFVSVQLAALLEGDLWRRCASHANAMAARLAERLTEMTEVPITRPVQANAVFARIPHRAIAELQADFDFYVWDEATAEVRWMCSWDTTEDDVEEFAIAVRDAVAGR